MQWLNRGLEVPILVMLAGSIPKDCRTSRRDDWSKADNMVAAGLAEETG